MQGVLNEKNGRAFHIIYIGCGRGESDCAHEVPRSLGEHNHDRSVRQRYVRCTQKHNGSVRFPFIGSKNRSKIPNENGSIFTDSLETHGSTIYQVVLRCHLYIETIILPRQARDIHRETALKKDITVFSGGPIQGSQGKRKIVFLRCHF